MKKLTFHLDFFDLSPVSPKGEKPVTIGKDIKYRNELATVISKAFWLLQFKDVAENQNYRLSEVKHFVSYNLGEVRERSVMIMHIKKHFRGVGKVTVRCR